jgi:DNA invertase Pin-like site-specific DNA recombinase
MPPHSTDAPSPVAYSYVRFSTPEQAKGDSLRRQTESAADWCKRHRAALDTATTLHDLGKSAYTGGHRQNADRHALAGFLKLVESGRVPRGSYLIVENLDRLTREHIRPALTLLLNLIEAGVRVVQLKPVEQVFDDKVEPMQLMMAIMELSRGHGESAMKSERNGKAWVNKRGRAREEGALLTRNLPGWVRPGPDGKPAAVPERAAVVKRIFEMAAAGYGMIGIAKRLNREGVPGFGPCGLWSPQYVHKVLKDRRAVGEFQLRGRGRKPEGDPISGGHYYPQVVTEEEWAAARAGMADRKIQPGRTGLRVNVFAGLLHDAVAGGSYIRSTMTEKRKLSKPRTWTILVNNEHRKGKTAARSFPFPTFERAVLSKLREIDPNAILGRPNGPDEVMVAAGQLAVIEAELAEADAFMEANGFSATIGKRVTGLEARKADLAAQLAAARQKEAHPLSEAWGEAKSLLEVLDSAPDPEDARLRLRSILRRIIERIDVYVTSHGKDRFAAVEVRFHTDSGVQRSRYYTIYHKPPYFNGKKRRPGGWKVAAWDEEDWAAAVPKSGVNLKDTPLLFSVLRSVPGWLEEPLSPLPEGA